MYRLFCMCYPKLVNFIEFLMDFCIYDDILDTIQITGKKLLHVKRSKFDQILRVDKTCFPRPGHIIIYIYIYIYIYIRIYVTRFAKIRHNDAFLEIQIFTSMNSIYLKLCSVVISMVYCKDFSS